MDEIQWEQPPDEVLQQRGRQPGRYLAFALELRKHPGRWAVLPGERSKGGAQGAAQNVRRGQTKGFTRGEYEAVSHDGKVWVRYVGPPEKRQRLPQDEGERDSPPPVSPVPTTPAAKVRAWAKQQGLDVPERGRLPEGVWEQYAAALQAGERGLPLRAVKGDGG